MLSLFKNWTPLHRAAFHGDEQQVDDLWKQNNAMIDIRTGDGSTAIHFAAFGGHLNIVSKLSALRPRLVFARDRDGKTALHFATINNQIPVIEYLLARYPTLIEVVADDNSTVLHYAASKGHLEAVRVFMNVQPMLVTRTMQHGQNALHCAAQHGHTDVIKFIVESNPELLYQKTNNGNTILHLVTSSVMLDQNFLNDILQKKPQDLRAVNTDQQTPFHIALSKQNMSAIELFQWSLTFDEITDALQQTHQVYTQFEQVMRNQCVSLNHSLLPDLLNIVFEYLGFDNTPRNSNKQKTH